MNNKTSLFILLWLTSILVSNTYAQEKLYHNSFPLSDVKITEGPFKHACDLNIEVLLQYDVDRLLAPFLREAGLAYKNEPYGNWESDGLDGHIGGHYLTAMALHYAVTGNADCLSRVDYMVAELKRCQENSKYGAGYIGGVPVKKNVDGVDIILWDEIRNGNVGVIWRYWVPWYNIHKTYAGLRDAWIYANNEVAKQVFHDLCDWGVELISNLDDQQMESMLANEFGGMNEVYADAYQIFGEEKYLMAAKRFSHKQIFDSMADKIDNLDNKHANTQVPKAVGYQRVAELTHEQDFTTAAEFFWETVVHNRSLSLGGNSRSEHFPQADRCFEYMDERQGPESCNTNNMLKLTEGLFRMSPKAEYADFYERAMFNHILSTQHPVHGGYVYFTPARPAHYRVYSAPEKAMWCCVGTGMENHAKYGDFIYTHNHDSLYVNLFVPSELNWRKQNVLIQQKTDFPNEEGSTLIISTPDSLNFKLFIRHPWWVKKGCMQVLCGGIDYARNSNPSSYIEIDKMWHNGDKIEIKMPMTITIEELPNVPNAISILRGPILLAAKVGTDNMPGLIAGSGRWEHIAHGSLVSVFDSPYILGDRKEILRKLNNMKPVEGKSFTFTAPDLFTQEQYKNIVFEPFYQIHDSRYMMYWLSMTKKEFSQFRIEKGKNEFDKMLLDKRTLDVVIPGEQQPEADHAIETQNSSNGYFEGRPWRSAYDGYFKYSMSTGGFDDVSLMLTYWGNQLEEPRFDIYIDNELVKKEVIAGTWLLNKFVDIEYKIPTRLLRNKQKVEVRIQSFPDSDSGPIFSFRLLRPVTSVVF